MMAAYIKPRASEYISRGFIYGRSDAWLNLILIVLHLSFLTLFIISFWFMLFSYYTRLLSIILTWKLVIKCSYYKSDPALGGYLTVSTIREHIIVSRRSSGCFTSWSVR